MELRQKLPTSSFDDKLMRNFPKFFMRGQNLKLESFRELRSDFLKLPPSKMARSDTLYFVQSSRNTVLHFFKIDQKKLQLYKITNRIKYT